jgi:NADH dehydrogenase [ubiquinone] 1 alpha subcomplex assembly factor 7
MPEDPKQLHNIIAERIRSQGPVTLAEYMGLALDAYYGSKNPFGVTGDFITAPEISQMFGEMIGAWLADLWLQMGSPPEVRLVELGPGRGTLAADIMRTISAWPNFKAAMTLHLVETSQRLRDIQASALKNHRALWHDSFSSIPEGICFVIANEFFDALPIQQFEKIKGKWRERRVGYDSQKNSFHFVSADPDMDITGLMPEKFLSAPEGSIFEISPLSLQILEEISNRISVRGGAALIIDYGHTEPGFGDTLQAVAQHQYSDPLQNPGEKDITAHVDFGTFKTVAEQTAVVAGPVTQGQFLTALGIESRARKLCEKADEKKGLDIMADLNRLVDPREMGRLFKVMALTPKETIIEPAGFNQDQQQ